MKILNILLIAVTAFFAPNLTAAVIYNESTSGNDAGTLIYVPNWTPGSTESPVPTNFNYTSWTFEASFDDETGDGSYTYTVTDGVDSITINTGIAEWINWTQLGEHGEGMEPDFTMGFWDAFWPAYMIWLDAQNNP